MSGAIESRIEAGSCGCEESMQLRHKNNSLQEQLQYLTDVVGKDETEGDLMSLVKQNEALRQKNDHLEADKKKLRQGVERNNLLQERFQYLTVMMDENENELMSLMKQNEDLRQKNDHLEADKKKLRQDVEILKRTHQLHTDIMNPLIYSPEPFGKDEPTGKKEMSDANVQTEGFGHLEDGWTLCTTIEVKMIEALYQDVKNKQTAMDKELGSAAQKIAMVVERLEIELKAKQALQADYDRVKADQQKSLLRQERDQQEFEELLDLCRKAVEQNEKLRDEMEHQRLVTLGTNAALYQTCPSLAHSLSEAIGKQNEVGQMIVNFQTKQKPGTGRCFKPLLVGFLVTVTIVFLASLVSISIDPTDPNALYDRHHYI